MQKPRKRFLSAIVAVAMCLSQFAPVTAYAVESSSGITQSEEAPKETDALSTTTTNSDSSATTPAPKSDVTDTASSASSDTSVTSDVSSEATSQAGSETTTAYANSAASDTGASTSTSSEASTTGSISEAAQAFIDAANALVSRKDEILTAANNFGLATAALLQLPMLANTPSAHLCRVLLRSVGLLTGTPMPMARTTTVTTTIWFVLSTAS